MLFPTKPWTDSLPSDNTAPTVSVVIPVFNNEKQAFHALSSVLHQTQPVMEIILVDDGSKASTVRALERAVERFAATVPVRLKSLSRNVGPGFARHEGARIASGDYIAFLDADDRWHRRKIELSLAEVRKHHAELVGHNRPWSFRPASELTSAISSPPPSRPLRRRAFLVRNPIPTSSIVVSRSIAATMFRTGGRRAEDYTALILASGETDRIRYIEADLAWAPKPPFGYSGEGADQVAMYKASLANVFDLFRSGSVSVSEFAVFLSVLALKVPRGLIRLRRYRLLATANRTEAA